MSKKIAFMGTPTISGQILKSLYQNGFDIEVVYTQPPVASNRGHRLNKSPVHIMAEILNIPVRTPIVLENIEEKNFLHKQNMRRDVYPSQIILQKLIDLNIVRLNI